MLAATDHCRRTVSQVGMTLAETLVTLAILGVILALGIPMLADWFKNSQIRTAAESLQNGLQAARNEAVRRNAPVEFRLTGAGDSSWEVWLTDTAIPAADRVVASAKKGEGSPDVVLASIPGTANMLTFDGMGRRLPASRQNADGSAVLTAICVDLPSNVLAATKTHDLEIDVGLGGTIRLCDPKVSSSTDTRVCAGYPTTCSGK